MVLDLVVPVVPVVLRLVVLDLVVPVVPVLVVLSSSSSSGRRGLIIITIGLHIVGGSDGMGGGAEG